MSPSQKLDVVGNVKGTQLCIAADCRSAWPSGGTVTSVGSGAGLTGGPITTSGSLSLNTASISGCTGSGSKIIWDSTNNRLNCGTDQTGSGVTGSGTINRISKWTSSSGIGDSIIYDIGNVGIGTASPSYKLDVAGSVNLNKGLTGTALSVNSAEAIWFNGDYFSWGYGGSKNYFADPVGIGISPTYTLDVAGTVNAQYIRSTYFGGGVQTLCYNSNGYLAACGSSIRYKKDINGLKLGLETVQQLKPVTFRWKETGEKDLGLVAEDVYSVDPILVTYNDNGEIEGVKYNQLTTVLINAIKELKTEKDADVEQLRAEVEQLHIQNQKLLSIICKEHPKEEICN